MGFAVPAEVGAKMARPELKTIVLVGDGVFQTTGRNYQASTSDNNNHSR